MEMAQNSKGEEREKGSILVPVPVLGSGSYLPENRILSTRNGWLVSLGEVYRRYSVHGNRDPARHGRLLLPLDGERG